MDNFQFFTTSEIQDILGRKIKTIRKSKGWTQKEMAKRADIPLSTYARFEQRGEGSMRDFAKILVILGRGSEIEKILNVAPKEESPMDIYRKIRKNKAKK